MLNPSKQKPKDDAWEETLEFHDGAKGNSIRLFDPETQRSIKKVVSFHVLPAREISLSDENIALFRKNWRSNFPGNPNQCSIYRDVSQSIASAGIEYYLPLFYKILISILYFLYHFGE